MSELTVKKTDFASLTRKLLAEFLITKGNVLFTDNYKNLSFSEVSNVLKIMYVLRAVGMLYFIDQQTFIFLGTTKTILKFIRFAKDKARKYEQEGYFQGKGSILSEEVTFNYGFRPPRDFRNSASQIIKIGDYQYPLFEYQMLGDFTEQLVMELLFDASFLKRQIN